MKIEKAMGILDRFYFGFVQGIFRQWLFAVLKVPISKLYASFKVRYVDFESLEVSSDKLERAI